jgi:hypothetical protein
VPAGREPRFDRATDGRMPVEGLAHPQMRARGPGLG